MIKNPFEILGVSNDASLEQVKKAYFRLIKRYPPEKNRDKFKQIRRAYESLKTEEGLIKSRLLSYNTGMIKNDSQSTLSGHNLLLDLSFTKLGNENLLKEVIFEDEIN